MMSKRLLTCEVLLAASLCAVAARRGLAQAGKGNQAKLTREQRKQLGALAEQFAKAKTLNQFRYLAGP